tara:strand:+ start:95 stop:544 length:450 start_codon:yes stop_codon:yes gene_type:complete
MTYTCKVCDVTSDAAEFYKGVTSRCKECHKRKVKENRDQKADYYREYDAKRFKEDPRVKNRHKRYAKTEAGKYSSTKSRVKWLTQNPDKRAAHVILGNAVRGGRVEKPKDCSRCGSAGRIDGHHYDYTKPLDVVWMCRQCHVNEHKETF